MGGNGKLEDLTGKRFGRLVVIRRDKDHYQPSGHHRPMWLCRCDCGNEKIILQTNLKRRTTRSCGCLQKEELSKRARSHGGWANNERLFDIWLGIRKRCNNENDARYPNYGGRGVSICDEWDDYSSFRDWAMSHGYADNLSIDRIDVNGDYCPDNCRWATNIEQQNNRRSCVYITYGNETHTLKEWSRIRGIKYSTLHSRYRHGWGAGRMLWYE